nr:putative beta-1,4-xylosyltransferase irx9h [Quercus suber]
MRRALSPVPRPGTIRNGEVCSVASPLSKSSSSPQPYQPSGGLLSSLLGSLYSQGFVLSVLSSRSSRPLERSKPKVQFWRRSLFHFLISFMVGVFIGLTPFTSMNLSTNLMSKHQAFPFEVTSTVGNFQSYDNVTRTMKPLDSGDIKHNATLESEVKEVKLMEEIHGDKFDSQLLNKNSNLVSRKLLIIVTPTYARPFQAYYLIRLAHTLKLVPPPLLWIVVEMTSQSAETADILRKTGVVYRHLVCNKNLSDIKDKYIHQRNVALSHIETHRLDGIVYFADDANFYLAELFEEMRQISQLLNKNSNLVSRKLLIIVTPTYARPFQAYYLIRLAHTLKLVPPPLLWIVVEMTSQSAETADILRKTGVVYRHLVCNKNLSDIKDKYIHQRNVALSHIETHRLDGIVYFADDANFYLAELFEEMRQIRRFGTWMVAKLTGNGSKNMLEGPICNGSQVTGWHINGSNGIFQRFHAEMSGFAFNSTILWDPKRWHRPTLEPIRQLDTVNDDFQVSTFIEQLVEDESQMEALLQDCSRIMVWNNYLGSSNSFYPSTWLMKNNLDVILPLT